MRSTATAAERRESFRDARGPGAIVFDPERMGQASADVLRPEHYGATAQPVSGSGRGAAWFVRGGFGEGVLRHYRRGGLAARLSSSGYLWLGEARVRSVAEFRLLAVLRRQGLPVPAPLLAGYWRQGLAYRAALLVQRIPGAVPLAAGLGPGAGDLPWEAVGEMLARFHAAGLDHADLNANNILLDAERKPWLIDLDRCQQRPAAGRWAASNLARLKRSLEKLSHADGSWRAGFERLHGAYLATPAGAVA